MSLAAPLYLAALAALALPWLLHRFSDAPPDVRAFPSTRFLEPTTPPVSRRRRLRHLVLLALRALALIALCLLFAEPWIPRPAALVDARRLHVVAVDTSLSMRAGERLERALDAARERLSNLPEGDSAQLLAFDRDVTLVTAEPLAPGEAAAALGRLAGSALGSSFAAADYGRLMQRLDRLADESPLPLHAVLITDVQRTALPERRNALYAPRLAALDVVDVGAGEANVSLAARATSEDGAQATLGVTLSASGGRANGAEGQPEAGVGAGGEVTGATSVESAFERIVLVSSDGEERARARVRLAPGARESVTFPALALPADGREPRFDVVLEGEDALAEDDGVTVAVRLDGGRRVALAALDARVSPASRVFATTGLEADGIASVDTAALSAGQFPEDQRRLVVFTPLSDGESLPSPLRRFVARGGSALLVDGTRRDEVDGDGALGDIAAGLGAGRADGADGFAAGDAVADGRGSVERDGESLSGSGSLDAVRGSGVGRVDESHPLALGEIDWNGTRFFSLGDYVPDDTERVLIETEDRRPVLIERPSEAGLLLLLNERLDGIDSNLPFQPAFVALMRRVVEWFDAGRSVPERVAIGEAVPLPVNVQVLDPGGRALVPLADTASAQTLRFDEPGLYTVVGALGEQTLAVTLDPRASDLTPMSAEAIAAWAAGHGAADGTASERGAGDVESGADVASPAGVDDIVRNAASSARERAERFAFWPFLLPLMAMLLMAETLFANRRLDVRRDGT